MPESEAAPTVALEVPAVVKGQLVALHGGGYGVVVAVDPGGGNLRIVDLGPARDYQLPVEPA